MQERLRRTNQERSETTRSALIGAARRLFLARSYAETGTPEVVCAAGVTRGALYHHFPEKQALFRAVVESEAAAVADEIERAAPENLNPLAALRAGGGAFLSAMAAPGRTRLMAIEAPAVLGRRELDEIDGRHAGRTLRAGLSVAMDAGAIPRLPIEPCVQLLSAAFDRAAIEIAGGAEPADVRQVLDALLDGLAAPAGR